MNENLTKVLGYLRKPKEHDLEETLVSAHQLLGEAIEGFRKDANRKPRLWLEHRYEWSDEKYAFRLEDLFLSNDVSSTSFPWFEVLQILFQLLKLLLNRPGNA